MPYDIVRWNLYELTFRLPPLEMLGIVYYSGLEGLNPKKGFEPTYSAFPRRLCFDFDGWLAGLELFLFSACEERNRKGMSV